MATLYFKVSSDYDEVIRLRQECEKLESQLKKMDVNKSPAAAKALETQLASARQQMMGLVTEAAKAGAVMENGFKKKIYDASQTVNGLSEKIIAQRAVIKDIEFDVKRLGDAYRTALKNNPIGASGKLAEYNAARKALDEEKAALFGLTQQQAEARLSVKKLRDEYSLYKKEAGDTVEINNGLSMSWGKMLGVIGGATALKSLASQIVRVRGEFQSMQTAIETMVGKDVASGLMAQLKEMAKISPLTLTDMVDAEKMMLGFNIQAEDTVRYLQALSDISMGDSVKFKSLTLAFSQMSAAGKLMGSDLNQMINAGFNPLQIISEKTGKSISTLKDEMSKGAVSAEMVQQAFIDATSAGGKFYQMSENASKTINGQLSMMQDALDNAFNEMGQASEGVIMKGIQLTTTLIQNYETVGKVLVGLVATYGAYRTAVMLATIATSKHTIAEVALTNARIIARKAQLLLNAAMLTNPYVAVATVITGLVATMWALSDSTTAAEKAQERFCQKSSEMKNKEEERKKSLESLISTINDETTATVARADALNKLKSEYPDIFKKYVDEKGHITDLIELWKEYNDQASVSSRESKQRMVENIDAQIAVTQNNLNTAKANSDWGSVKKYREQLESLQKERAKWVKEVLTDVNRELSVKEEAPKTYAEDYEQARKDWEEAKKELEKIEAEKDKFTSEQYEKAKKRVETTEKSYKNLGGVTSDKPIKDAQKEADQQKKEQQQLAEELLQIRRTNQQNEINLMEDGAEKKRRQIELDYQKEIDEIKKQRKKWEDAQGGKLTSEQRDVLGNRASNAMQSREKGLAAITDTENQAAIEANERYLKNYGTFMQKRQAITDEYTRKISEATTQGDKDILQKEMEKALSSLDLEKLKQGINWELVFGDLDKVSKESLNKVKQQLRDFKNSDEYKNMAVDQKKVVDEALNNIQSTLIDKGGLLADLPEQLSELAKAQEELLQAQEEYNEAMRSGTDAQKEAATKKLNDAQKRQQNAQVNVQKSTDKTTSNLIALSNVITQLGSNSEMSLSEIGSLASDVVDVFTEAGSKIGGIIGAAFSLLDAIGTQGLDGFVDNLFGSVFRAVGGIWDTLTFGLIGNKESDPYLKYDLEKLTISNQDLKASLDNLAEKMDESAVADATGLYEQQKKNIEEQMANTKEMMQRSAAAYSNGFLGIGGTHSSNKKINDAMSAEDWKRVSEAAGVSVKNAGDFWNLTSEQMYNVANNATDLYSKIKQYADDGYQNASQYMDSYIEYWKQLDDLEDTYREKLTDTSFDSVRDEFKDKLIDMESDAEDFAEDFEKMMQQAVVESMMSDTYANRLKEWYKNFSNSMTDGTLSSFEQSNLKSQWDQMVSDALAERNAIMQAMGWEGSSSEQQSASSRGFGTEMTHEDAGELSGRFTAVYESNLRIETAEQQQTVAITELRGSISALTAQVTGLYNIADETRTILANSYLELQQIRENTGEIVKPIKQMQADIAEVKHNTARL
jgi:tape measure domain-containing protein